jgi:carboxylesterase type B
MLHSLSLTAVQGTPIVYVNFNYRLGPLGFAQGQEAGNKDAVNLGLSDQIAALQWVQKNLVLFGGDPTKVRPPQNMLPHPKQND